MTQSVTMAGSDPPGRDRGPVRLSLTHVWSKGRKTMTRQRLYLSLHVVAVLFALAASAQALPVTFVSGTGSNANPCTFTLPCRTFSVALGVTNPGGELVVLSPAVYGTATITQSVSITAAPGVYAGVVVPAGNGITINAGANDVVVLRGLSFLGVGGLRGISVNSVGALHVENVVMSGFVNQGLAFLSPGKLFVKDTIARDNGAAGIDIGSAQGQATASLDHVRLEHNAFSGLIAHTRAKVVVRDSVAAGNAQGGFIRGGVAGGELTVDRCTANHNTLFGIAAVQGLARVTDSTVIDNGTGLQVGAGGTIETRGNNTVQGNGVDVSGVLTPILGT
jgi:parallel beta helix pectate lyase-like protein